MSSLEEEDGLAELIHYSLRHAAMAMTLSLLNCGVGYATTVPASDCSAESGALSSSQSEFATASSTVIAGVPAYLWYHGCGPTAAASVLGYWDLNGYGDIFDASGTDVFLTENVKDHISSPAHNAKYDPTPDAPGPIPEPDSIASFFRTSVDPLGYGWSYNSYADDAFVGYANYRGYTFEASQRSFSLTWSDLTAEIDARRPLMFLVDTGGDGGTDHFVPVVGYDERGTLDRYYGFYTTWSESEIVQWRPFARIASGVPWGIYGATFIRPIGKPAPAPVPVPATIVLLGTSTGIFVAGSAFRRRKTCRRIS